MRSLAKRLSPAVLPVALLLFLPAVSLASPPNDKFLSPDSGVQITLPGSSLVKLSPAALKNIFYTKDLENSLEFAKKAKDLQNVPITQKNQKRLHSERKTLANKSLMSIDRVYRLATFATNRNYLLEQKSADKQAEESLESGISEIDLWYEENKSEKGALEKSLRMRIRLIQMVESHRQVALSEVEKKHKRSLAFLKAEKEVFDAYVREINQETKVFIDLRPISK